MAERQDIAPVERDVEEQSPVQESALSTRSGSIPESSSDGNTECSPKLFAHGRVLHDADQPLDSIGMEQLTIDEKIDRKVANIKKELSDRMQLLEDKLKSKEEELGKLTKERNDLLEKLSNEKKRRDEQVEVLERENKKLENTIESLNEEITRLKEQIGIAINQSKTLEDQVQALQRKSTSTEVENESDQESLEKSLCAAISSIVKQFQFKEDMKAVIVKASSKTKKDFKNSNKDCEDSNNNEQHPQSED